MTAEVTIFNESVNDLIESIKKRISYPISFIKETEMSSERVEALADETLSQQFSYPKVKINEGTKSYGAADFTLREGNLILGRESLNFSSNNTVKVTTLRYSFNYTGDQNAFKYSLTGTPLTFEGNLTSNSIIIIFHFEGDDISTNGPKKKALKDELMDNVYRNLADVQNHIENERSSLREYAILEINKKIAANLKYKNDLDVF